MQKKQYEAPVLEVLPILQSDIICASSYDGEWDDFDRKREPITGTGQGSFK